MPERKINLENILIKMFENGQPFYNQKDIKNAMLQFGKQLLELAAENAYCTITLHKDLSMTAEQNKQSILDTINQVV